MLLHRTAVLLLASALALPACNKSDGGKAALPPASGASAAPLPEIPHVATATAASTAPQSGATTGTLMAASEVAVAPRSSGTIVELKVGEGDKVRKNDVLFRIDSRDAGLRRNQAVTQLRGAKLQVATLQTEFDRAKSLFEQNAMPRQQWDQIQAQLEAAQIQVAMAQNAVAMADKAIADAVTRAPMDGVVLSKLLDVGEYATTMPPSPVVILQDQRTLELRFRLTERALPMMHIGDKVSVSFPALGTARTAEIKRISPTIDVRSRTIELVAVLDNQDGALKPGLMAQVVLGGTPELPVPAPVATPGAEAPVAPAAPVATPTTPAAPDAPKPKPPAARPAPTTSPRAAGGAP